MHFFENPILNSPYTTPDRHWELDPDGRPTDRVVERRRRSDLISAMPGAKSAASAQASMTFDTGDGLSSAAMEYNPTPFINELRAEVDTWRRLPNPAQWQVSPVTQRLLQHWRALQADETVPIRPFFCQLEAVEVAIWLAEVAPKMGKRGKRFQAWLKAANEAANPDLFRVALKLATGAGKTTVMAMLIAWQTLNAVRSPGAKSFGRGFVIVTPGITIRDRLRVLLPAETDNYYRRLSLVPSDLMPEMGKAKIVITNYHAFKLRERVALTTGTRAVLEGHAGDLQTEESEGQMLQRVMPDALYGHYDKTYRAWEKARIGIPPVFIVVCNNTTNSELVRDYIAGFEREDENGFIEPVRGRCPLFHNFADDGERLARPRTILLDSATLESGGEIDKSFRDAHAEEIAAFRREKAARGEGTGQIDDAEILREVMNTVGKKGRLGEQVRCVVSVSMLTEGWDANNVTHILGLRAFGTRLICEQVIGRALRRISYDVDPDTGRFRTEYADIMGIDGLNFSDQPRPAPPQVPRQVVHVHAVSPERDHLEITFPRVEGYRVDLPEDRLEVDFSRVEPYVLTPEKVGAAEVTMQGIVGEAAILTLDHLG